MADSGQPPAGFRHVNNGSMVGFRGIGWHPGKTMLPIIKVPDPRLYLACRPAVGDGHERHLAGEMRMTAIRANALGLAAPQVGDNVRIIIVRVGRLVTYFALFNPVITWRSEQTAVEIEGCLSLPGVNIPVRRSCEIEIRFRTRSWGEEEMKIGGLEARIVQHEIDHLDGKLIA